MLIRRPRGFTLIEALVGLALMLAGIAGAGIVLLQSVQYERESSGRRSAMRLAASLADELRALVRADGNAIPSDEPALIAWLETVRATLPTGANATIEPDEAMPVTYTITIEWPVAGVGLQRLVLPVTP
jgi:prepilin-type N-terminal cleavage/methylation domain-containing protein